MALEEIFFGKARPFVPFHSTQGALSARLPERSEGSVQWPKEVMALGKIFSGKARPFVPFHSTQGASLGDQGSGD
jgi:hypothetical protein